MFCCCCFFLLPLPHTGNINKDLRAILNRIRDVNVVWKELGLTLEIEPGKLKEIAYDKRDMAGECMWETIAFWLSGNGSTPTSWRTLLNALRDPQVDEKHLADSIEKELRQSPSSR